MVKRILNVAEKPDAAKKIATILSKGQMRTRSGKSVYNKIFEFEYRYKNQNVVMVVTSVTGHLMELDFEEQNRGWTSCDPVILFNMGTNVVKTVAEDKQPVAETLRNEAQNCDELILWLDCDREGENIAFEVLAACQQGNRNLKINNGTVSRARFSEFTERAIIGAMNDLKLPNERDSMAVDARQEIDLRIGAAFTRFQTIRLKEKFAGLPEKVISYGPCQFPTLGFVVQRFLRIKNFMPEEFWSIQVIHEKGKSRAEFLWKRGRLFDRLSCLVLYELCVNSGEATVTSVNSRERRKWKPIPLNTVELQKLASRKLRMGAHETMEKAEALYNQGFISYPRTETNKYTLTDEELKALANEHVNDNRYGNFAQQLVDGDMFGRPRIGNSDDKAHPPIHPIKAGTNLTGKEQQLHELITRYFLACCSKDAIGHETTITIEISGEVFICKGLMIMEENYLNVLSPYEKWTDKSIPKFEKGEKFRPTSLLMREGKTQAPPLLSESDLISLMDKHQIGTDATIAQHIKTICDRGYAVKKPANNQLEPTELGLALVQGYDSMGLEGLSKPSLRAKMEADMATISRGETTKDAVLMQNLEMYKSVFVDVTKKARYLDQSIAKYFKPIGDDVQATRIIESEFTECGICKQMMDLKSQGERIRFLYCENCDKTHIVPSTGNLTPHQHRCPLCQFQILEVYNDKTQKKHTVCPFCFKNPPATEDIDTHMNGFRCFNCSANCPMATKRKEDIVATQCDICRTSPMTLRSSKEGKYRVSCKGFPNCKHAVWLPTAQEIKLTSTQCRTCRNRGRVLQLQFIFEPGQVPTSIPHNITTCVFCESGDLASLIRRSGHEGGQGINTVTIHRPDHNTIVNRKSPPRARPIPQVQQRSLTGREQQTTENVLGKRQRSSTQQRPPMCYCDHPCRMFTVSKAGPNEGRKFWKCATQAEQCKSFFKWDDEE